MENQRRIIGLIVALVAVVCVAVFVAFGFLTGKWHLAWMVFLLVPITALTGQIIVSRNKTGSLIGLIAVLCAAVVIWLGFSTGQWHLVWMIFLIIPITVLIIQIVKAARS